MTCRTIYVTYIDAQLMSWPQLAVCCEKPTQLADQYTHPHTLSLAIIYKTAWGGGGGGILNVCVCVCVCLSVCVCVCVCTEVSLLVI